ncbi:MAG: hypothetical protein PVJ98_06820 [Akkermansiaceae bacterium]|jgi:hypothetical protein
MNLQDYLFTPFAGGLGLGLLMVFFTWKSGFTARRSLKREIQRMEEEGQVLQKHLNTQLKINAEGNESLQAKLETLREQNENLRVNVSELQQKPGRAELRQLSIIENAIGLMREQAPGFAQAWEKAIRQAETDYQASEGGLKKLVRKVLPTLGTAGIQLEDEKSSPDEAEAENQKKESASS